MFLKHLLFVVLIAPNFIIAFSQEKLNLDHASCCTFNGAPIPDDIYSFKSSQEAVDIVDNIVNRIGLKRNFKIQAGNVPNAAAVILESDRYIIYSQNFMSHIINESNSYWAAIGIMAHEVAHHLNGHTLKGGSRPPTELEADEFAGFICQKMGASLSEAQSMFNNKTMYQPFDSKTHPATSARLEAVAVGWQKAREQSDGGNSDVHYDFPDQNTENKRVENMPDLTYNSDNVQFVNITIDGTNYEIQIKENKEVALVLSRERVATGEQTTTVSSIGSLVLYQHNNQDFYSVNFGLLDPTNNMIEYYVISIYSDRKIYFYPYDYPEQLSYIGLLKFDWGISPIKKESSQNFYRLKFKNSCHYEVSVLICYQHADGTWYTDGWWILKPNDMAYVKDIYNPNFYYYAVSSSGLQWTDQNIFHFNGVNYGFMQTAITGSYGDFIQNLTCVGY